LNHKSLISLNFFFGQPLIGVLIGFTGLIPKPRYGVGARFLRISKGKSASAKEELIAAGKGFQRDNLIAANQAFAATASIRIGVIAFGAGLLIAMFAWTANQPIKPANTKKIIPAMQAEVAKPSNETSQLPKPKVVSSPSKEPAQKNTSEEKLDTRVPVKDTEATTTPNSPLGMCCDRYRRN
jgi:hypothetical protein